ncbi:MAG: DEAD/DEAH box helicase [Candidatus Paracaedibacteraceae bacterium]|nr:DEAD/DEAH box helicase [Candidatus Paracaedibacteraceae bacterium]
MTQFTSLSLIEPLTRALNEEGYTTPTPIQQQSIPHLLAGRDLLGFAQTGTGKTAAFSLPILQRMAEAPKKRQSKMIRALILAPTRELAAQIADSFKNYGRYLPFSCMAIYGGIGRGAQIKAMERGMDILVATPGRFLDLASEGHIQLANLDFFVLDEADQMFDMGFIHDLRKIIKMIPAKRQTLLFSATMPTDIANIAQAILTNPEKVEVTPVATTAEKIDQRVIYVEQPNKNALLGQVMQDPTITRALVFSRTKHGANKITQKLMALNVSAEAIHGNKSQTARQKALDGFKSGAVRVLVATDIAARGIDVDNVSHVINFDLPNVPESYIHRIGRTARANTTGISISFCSTSEKPFLRDIEKLIRKTLPSEVSDVVGTDADRLAAIDDAKREMMRNSGGRGRGPNQGGRGSNSSSQPNRARPNAGPNANRSPAGRNDRGRSPGGASKSR